MRCFAAVEVTGTGMRRSLEAAQVGLRRGFGPADPVKWVPAHQLHMTLKFFGEISEAAADQALQALKSTAGATASFELEVGGLGAFPSPQRPSVLWAGIQSGKAELNSLAAAVENGLAAIGFPREQRPFQPHLTLGRVREGARVPLAVSEALAAGASRPFGRCHVGQVVLMKSELTRQGPVYTVYGIAPLREEKDGGQRLDH